jgi:hypothetical protein
MAYPRKRCDPGECGRRDWEARIALLEAVLGRCREKLEINRAHSDGEYHGGMEHTALIRWINEVLPKTWLVKSTNNNGADRMALEWKRDPLLDTWEATAPEGKYLCVRTHLDVAVLYLDGQELRRSASDGSSEPNRRFAEKHHATLSVATQ